MSSPAYLMYPGDILASGRVAALEPLEELWYRRAIDLGWEPGGMPKDPVEFAGWVGRGCTPKAAEKIIKKFYQSHRKDAAMVVQPRQEIERKKILKKKRQKSEAGKRGMASRWKQRGKSDNSVITEDNIPIPIPITKEEKKEEPPLREIFAGTVLSGVAQNLGLKRLSTAAKSKWGNEACLAFENGFTAAEFVECHAELNHKHTYTILPEYVTDRLPTFIKSRRKVVALPSPEQNRQEDAEQRALGLRRAPGGSP